MTTTSVFVYGTLRPIRHGDGFWLDPDARVNPARLVGYSLFNTGAFPVIRPSRHMEAFIDRVIGDIIHITPDRFDAVMAELDRIEGVSLTPPMYTRETVTVAEKDPVGGIRNVEAFVYVGGEDFWSNRMTEWIPSGDWYYRPPRLSIDHV